jgi:hypothetical protein
VLKYESFTAFVSEFDGLDLVFIGSYGDFVAVANQLFAALVMVCIIDTPLFLSVIGMTLRFIVLKELGSYGDILCSVLSMCS